MVRHYKCAKCGISAAEDPTLSFHRFPYVGKRDCLKARVWATYCYPDRDWSPKESLATLYKLHKVLCSKHFDVSSYTSSAKNRLNVFAIPHEAKDILLMLRAQSEALDTQEANKSQDVVSDTSQEPWATHYYDMNNKITLNNVVQFEVEGIVPPVFTPLNDDYTINYDVIPEYAQYLAKSGIKAVLVGGTTGENMSLSISDRKKLMDAWVKMGRTHNIHIQVQVGGAPLADVLELTVYAVSVGVDSLLTLPELYFKPSTVEALVFYVEQVANTAPSLPVLYYHIPSMTNVNINMPSFVAAATARIPNFKGLKFTSNDLSEGAQVMRSLKEDQTMFLGADTLLAPAALLGIRSSIGTSFNMFPQLGIDILSAVENNDIMRARALQERLSLAIEAHTVEGDWVPVMKAGMEIVTGIKMGPPCLPQQPISADARFRIGVKLRDLSVF